MPSSTRTKMYALYRIYKNILQQRTQEDTRGHRRMSHPLIISHPQRRLCWCDNIYTTKPSWTSLIISYLHSHITYIYPWDLLRKVCEQYYIIIIGCFVCYSLRCLPWSFSPPPLSSSFFLPSSFFLRQHTWHPRQRQLCKTKSNIYT